MDNETIDQKLRAMAEHRGLKLVKSRRRKPGVGDYGKFGLTDADGKPLLGISDAGLEASADDVETYLRAGAASTWKASADSTPARVKQDSRSTTYAKGDAKKADDDDASVIRPRASRKREATAQPPRKSATVEPSARTRPKTTATEAAVAADHKPSARTKPTPPEPELTVRLARPADAEALLPLLRQLAHVKIDELAVARNLKTALKADAGMAVAELDGLVGCCAWAVIPAIQHGPVGRLTVLLVAEEHRRNGIATALLEMAVTALRNAGCKAIEAMSDIEVRNAHNFFRTLKFEQTSYRFARPIDDA